MTTPLKDLILKNALEILSQQFSVKKVYLFGSRVDNQQTSQSDYDLVLVIDATTESLFDRRVRARVALKNIPSSFDVFVYTENEFKNSSNDFGSIPETALSTGLELHL